MSNSQRKMQRRMSDMIVNTFVRKYVNLPEVVFETKARQVSYLFDLLDKMGMVERRVFKGEFDSLKDMAEKKKMRVEDLNRNDVLVTDPIKQDAHEQLGLDPDRPVMLIKEKDEE